MITEKVLKELMLGLIYPAVLGTIMYSGLDSVYMQCLLLLSALRGGVEVRLDLNLALKFLLLAVTLAFYVCDYLYIRFTEPYRKLFFAFDLLFLIGLYITVRALNLADQELPLNAAVIAICYLVFMVLYYIWDRLERPREPTPKRQHYNKVLRWEEASMVALVSWFVVDGVSTRWRGAPVWVAAYLLLILTAITWYFARYTWAKKAFCNDKVELEHH